MDSVRAAVEKLADGAPVRMRVFGGSMYPFIRDGETVRIEPVSAGAIRRADIVLRRDGDGKAVLHRVLRVGSADKMKRIVTGGDSSRNADGCVDPAGVLGRVVAIEKEGATLRLDTAHGRAVNTAYAALLPLSKPVGLVLFGLARARTRSRTGNARPVRADHRIDYSVAARNMLIYETAEKLIRSFNEAGIGTIILKGLFLAERIYGNIGLRPMTDIDILIRREDLPAVNGLLNRAGYPTPGHYRDLVAQEGPLPVNSIMYLAESPRSPSVHIHWHIINSTWPVGALVAGIDIGRFWSDARPATIGSIPTKTFSAEHLLIHLACHGFHHAFDKPSMAKDITETIRHYGQKLDWRLVRQEADRFGLLGIIYCALAFSAAVSGSSIPQAEFLRPARSSALEKIVSLAFRGGIAGYALSYTGFLSLQKGALNKAAFFLRTVMPPRIIIAHNYRIPLSRVTASHYRRRASAMAA